LNVCVPSKIHVGTWILNATIVKDGAFMRWWDQKGSDLVDGISVSYKSWRELAGSFLPLYVLPCEDTAIQHMLEAERSALSRHGPSTGLILDFPASGTVREKCLLLMKYLVSSVLLQQPEWSNTITFFKMRKLGEKHCFMLFLQIPL
jgi:hypothetical protein